MKVPRILSIAGSDSGGGAGIQADIRTISALGGYAMTAITAITAQNSLGVDAVMPIAADLVIQQIDVVVRDFGVDAIKIGLLGSADMAKQISHYISEFEDVPIIFDPVMVTTSGAKLADDKIVDAFRDLIEITTLLTPNLPEFEKLSHHYGDYQFPCDILLKGGHGEGDILIDKLMRSGIEVKRWEGKRIQTRHNHGTGCTLSSAIAIYMGHGLDMVEAISKARDYVRESLRCAPEIGEGYGPMGLPKKFVE